MLAIYLLFCAGALRADPRAGFPSLSAALPRARAPAGASRVSWTSRVADVLPLRTTHHHHQDLLLPPSALVEGDASSRAADAVAALPRARAPAVASRASLTTRVAGDLLLCATHHPQQDLLIPPSALVEGDASSRVVDAVAASGACVQSQVSRELVLPRTSSHQQSYAGSTSTSRLPVAAEDGCSQPLSRLWLTAHVLSQRDLPHRCGVLAHGSFVYLPCDDGVPLHLVATIHLPTYHSMLQYDSYASPTTSVEELWFESSSSVEGGHMGLGSVGSAAWLRSAGVGFLLHNSDTSLDYFSPSITMLTHALRAPRHWLAHYDFDLKMRRSFKYAFVPYFSKSVLSGPVQVKMRSLAPIVYNASLVCIYGAHAIATAFCVFDPSVSPPCVQALVSNACLLWSLVGSECFMSFGALPFTFVCRVAFICGRPAVAHRALFTAPLFWAVCFSNISRVSAVCLSCSGNDPNCKGDSTCVLAMALAANALVMAGSVNAAKAITMGDGGKHILPLSWLQFLKPSVLQTLVALAKRAPSGTPLDLSALSIKELAAHISSGTVSVTEGRLDFLRRMTDDNVSDSDLTKMKTICEGSGKKAQRFWVASSPRP